MYNFYIPGNMKIFTIHMNSFQKLSLGTLFRVKKLSPYILVRIVVKQKRYFNNMRSNYISKSRSFYL